MEKVVLEERKELKELERRNQGDKWKETTCISEEKDRKRNGEESKEIKGGREKGWSGLRRGGR